VCVQCPPRKVCKKVWVSEMKQQTVDCVRYERECVTKQVPCTVCRYVSQPETRTCSHTTCQMVSEQKVRTCTYTTCTMVPEQVHKTCTYRPHGAGDSKQDAYGSAMVPETVKKTCLHLLPHGLEQRVKNCTYTTCCMVREDSENGCIACHMVPQTLTKTCTYRSATCVAGMTKQIPTPRARWFQPLSPSGFRTRSACRHHQDHPVPRCIEKCVPIRSPAAPRAACSRCP
jgi:hypothetical protein